MKKLATASRHSSESADHYTPAFIVNAAREALGGSITLDPASCAEANKWIKADTIYTRKQDGFVRPWYGNVFLNPPGGLSDNKQRPVKLHCRETGACGLSVPHTHEGVEPSQKKWWWKLVREYASGRVKQAIFVCFSVELLQNTQCNTPEGCLLPLDFPICFPKKRVSYVKPGGGVGKAPPHASCIVFLGRNDATDARSDVRRRFAKAFAHIGYVIGVPR
jgi:hypothetical protein